MRIAMIRDCGDIRKEGDFVSKNQPCQGCSFPNYDYQVSKKTGLCRECEKKTLLKGVKNE